MPKNSIEIFDTQFEQQVQQQDFVLNPFETVALDYLKGTVLDYGSGLGNLSLEAGRRGHQVLAVDASPAAVARINADAQSEALSVRAIREDIVTWEIGQSYDTIVAIGLLSYFPRRKALELLLQLQAHVKPGGRAIVNLMIEGTSFMDLFHRDQFYLFAPDELENQFSDWKVLYSCQQSFAAPQGTVKEFSTVIAEKSG